MTPGEICFHGFNFHVKWRETSSYLESDSFYHFEEGIEKAPYDDFRDILIQWMHTPTDRGRFAITFWKGKHLTSSYLGEKRQEELIVALDFFLFLRIKYSTNAFKQEYYLSE